MTISKRVIAVIFTVLFIFCLSLFNESYAYKFEFTTVSDVVKKIKERFAVLESYQANFKIVSDKSGSKKRQSGKVYYKNSSKMLIEFHEPYGQKIVSDGKTMWLYIPSMNVVAEQDLKRESGSIFSSVTRSGLRRLFSKYHYKFASKKQPEVQPDGAMAYTLFLKQRESRSGFRTLKLWISDEYLITRVYGETSSGKNVEIKINNIKTDVVLSNGLFKFDVPSKAKIIKNPFVSEE